MVLFRSCRRCEWVVGTAAPPSISSLIVPAPKLTQTPNLGVDRLVDGFSVFVETNTAGTYTTMAQRRENQTLIIRRYKIYSVYRAVPWFNALSFSMKQLNAERKNAP
jgi:hypothetical protein